MVMNRMVSIKLKSSVVLKSIKNISASSSFSLITRRYISDEPVSARMVTLKINNKSITVPENTTILDAAKKLRIHIPVLCYHPMLSTVGTCRFCLVSASTREGAEGKLVPSCYTKVQDGLIVQTHNAQVKDNAGSLLGFIKARHPDSCITCKANGNCELQDLSFKLKMPNLSPDIKPPPRSTVYDDSSPAVVRDMAKCVLCSRCIRVCAETQGMNILGMVGRGANEAVSTINDAPLAQTACISCGQCTSVCPVGALTERSHIHPVLDLLADAGGQGKIVVASTAPAVRVAISEEFGAPPGSVTTGKLVAALKALGFDYVFDTNFTADVTIMEESDEFVKRYAGISKRGKLPMFTSCCPGWIEMIEKSYPEMLPHLSSCKSPQAMQGSLIKTYFAKKLGIPADKIYHVSIMPCVAKKAEAVRPQLRRMVDDSDNPGNMIEVPDTDHVLTTRELAKMIKHARIPYNALPDVEYDTPLGLSTGAAVLFGATGGVMEAALRTAHYAITKTDLSDKDIVLEPVRSLASSKHAWKEANVKVGPYDLSVAVVTGGANIRKIIDSIRNWKEGDKKYDLIEVMACPGGCIGGGGEPKTSAMDPDIIKKRILAIRGIDKTSKLRMSHHNPAVKELYDDFLGTPNSPQAHDLLHTHYTDRRSEVWARMDEYPPGVPPTVAIQSVSEHFVTLENGRRVDHKVFKDDHTDKHDK